MILAGESIISLMMRALSNPKTNIICNRFVVKLIIDSCLSRFMGLMMLRCFCWRISTYKNICPTINLIKQRSFNLENLHMKRTVNIVGTGFNQTKALNVSTISCFILSGGDAIIIKHGGARVSSRCGSADMILKLQSNAQYSLKKTQLSILENGVGVVEAGTSIGFLEHLRCQRKKLNLPSFLNLVVATTNITNAQHYVLGCSNRQLLITQLLAASFSGVQSSIVLGGRDGMDKLSPKTITPAFFYRNYKFSKTELCPEFLGTPIFWAPEVRTKERGDFLLRFLEVISGSTQWAAQSLTSHSGLALSKGAKDLVRAVEETCTRIFEGETFRRVAMFIRLNQCRPVFTKLCRA